MKFSTIFTLATLAVAAPTSHDDDRNLIVNKNPLEAMDAVSEYFNVLAQKVKTYKSLSGTPGCNPIKATLPSSNLSAVSSDLSLLHIAVGRGTQNYTCTTPDSIPKAAGAVAALFNSTCSSTLYPPLSTAIPKLAVHFPMTNWAALDVHSLGPTGLSSSGLHYFQPINSTTATPFFTLEHIGLGAGKVAVNSSVAAPTDAPTGQLGEKAVAWLKLVLKADENAPFKEVYRVNTVGGSAPATCEGMNSTFTVEYSAQYWFFGNKTVQSTASEL